MEIEIKKGIHYSTELEQAILGVCLIERDGMSRIYGMLEPDSFYHTGHKIVFQAMLDMFRNGMMIDTLTVIDFIMRIKKIDTIENHNVDYFVCRLTNSVVSGAHLAYHAHIVKSMWMERELIYLTHGSEKLDGDVQQQIRIVQNKLNSLQDRVQHEEWLDMTQLMVNLYRHQEEMKKTGGVGIITGFPTIDTENGGFHDGNLIVIGSRPSTGKSALLGAMAIAQAKQNKTVGIISLEMPDVEIAARLVAYDTETDFNVVFRGLYRDENDSHRLYTRIAQSTSTLPIYVSDKTRVSVPEIRAKAEKLKAMHGLDCLYIDYLQLIDTVGAKYNRNRENEVSEMSRGLKVMAKELNIPTVLLAQLNREVTKRKGTERYPQLSDLRESGAIEQDADIVMFLHRDFMAGFTTDENGHSTERQGDLVVRKWRNGRANFIIPLDFDPPKMKFTERRMDGFRPVTIPPSPYETEKKTDDDANPF